MRQLIKVFKAEYAENNIQQFLNQGWIIQNMCGEGVATGCEYSTERGYIVFYLVKHDSVPQNEIEVA